MTLNNTYQVKPTHTFKLELLNIIHYIKTSLNRPQNAIFIYNRILRKISSLKFMPERYVTINNSNKNLRKVLIDKYIIIYETNNFNEKFLSYISFTHQNIILINCNQLFLF